MSDPATLKCGKCVIEEWPGKCIPNTKLGERPCQECLAHGSHITYRIVQCKDCKGKATKGIESKSLQDTARKENVMKMMAKANPIPNVQEWSSTQERVSRKLGLTLRDYDIATYGLKCETCGKYVGKASVRANFERQIKRKPRLMLCEEHYKLYRKLQNRRLKQAERARKANVIQ